MITGPEETLHSFSSIPSDFVLSGKGEGERLEPRDTGSVGSGGGRGDKEEENNLLSSPHSY